MIVVFLKFNDKMLMKNFRNPEKLPLNFQKREREKKNISFGLIIVKIKK